MRSVRFGIIVLAVAASLAGCVDVDSLTRPYPQSSRHDDDTGRFPGKTPDIIPAKGVIDKGKSSGTFDGATYVCADGGCTMAKRVDHKTSAD